MRKPPGRPIRRDYEVERAYCRFPDWLHQIIRERSKAKGKTKNDEIMDMLKKLLEIEEAQKQSNVVENIH